MGEMVCCVWHVCGMWVAWVKEFVMVALAQWLFKFGKVMFGWNTWSVIGGMVAMVLHRWHGRKGLSKGYISGGLFVMVVYLRYFVVGGISVILLFLCGSCVCGRLLFCAAEATKTVHFFGNFGRHWLVNSSIPLMSWGTFWMQHSAIEMF